MCGFSKILILKGIYDVLKSKSPCFSLNKTINFNKYETESKMENAVNDFRKTKLVLQLI